jgi:hypothetical protein
VPGSSSSAGAGDVAEEGELVATLPPTARFFAQTNAVLPGGQSNEFLYYIRAVGAPGDPEALSDILGPVCLSTNSATLNLPSAEVGMQEYVAERKTPVDPGVESQGVPYMQESEARIVGQAGGTKEILFFPFLNGAVRPARAVPRGPRRITTRSVSRALRSVWREGFSPGPERRQARRVRVMERGVIGCGEQRPYGFSGGRRFGSSRATRRGWT